MEILDRIGFALPYNLQDQWIEWREQNTEELRYYASIDDKLPWYWSNFLRPQSIVAALAGQLYRLEGVGQVRANTLLVELTTWPQHLWDIVHNPEKFLDWESMNAWYRNSRQRMEEDYDGPRCQFNKQALRSLRAWAYENIDIDNLAPLFDPLTGKLLYQTPPQELAALDAN